MHLNTCIGLVACGYRKNILACPNFANDKLMLSKILKLSFIGCKTLREKDKMLQHFLFFKNCFQKTFTRGVKTCQGRLKETVTTICCRCCQCGSRSDCTKSALVKHCRQKLS